MTNLPTSGQGNSLDNFNVDRADYRQGMQNLLAFLAEGLGGIPVGTFTTQAITSASVSASLGWTRTGTTIAPKTAGDVINFSGGTQALPGLAVTGDPNTGIYSAVADQLEFTTGGVSRLLISPTGSIGVGSPGVAGVSVRFGKPLTGGASTFGLVSTGLILKDATASAKYFATEAVTEAAAFSLSFLNHYTASQVGLGAGSSITNQYGFSAEASLVGAAHNYGFFSAIPAGTNNYAFYSSGTANCYFSSDNFIFANGGTERARFDVNGKLLIGRSVATGGPAIKLEVDGIADITGELRAKAYAINAAATGAPPIGIGLYAPSGNTLVFVTDVAERLRLDAAGNVLVGMSVALAGSRAKLQCATTANLGAVTVHADNTAAKAGGLVAGDIYRQADGTLMIAF